MILFVGDIHGKESVLASVYEDAEKLGASSIIQVGDFGIHWPGRPNGLAGFFDKSKSKIPFYFCDGNHENHRLLDKLFREQQSDVVEVAKNCFHVRRGTVLDFDNDKILFFGGAQSYLGKRDDPFVLDENWWPRELPNLEEFDLFKTRFSSADIIVTHDCPGFLMRDKKYHKLWSKNGVPQFLKDTIENSDTKPVSWFFGHHHDHSSWDIDSTKYYCCGKHGESWLYSATNCVKQGQRTVE